MTDFCLEHPLPSNCPKQYAGMAFDGCQYYLPVRDEKSVFVLDSSLRPQEHIETCRSYSAICYDPEENCFWAASRGCAAVLFQLTSCLEEIDKITVNTGCWGNADITGISCCTPGGTLLLSAGNAVLCFDKRTGCSTVLFKETGPAMITGVVCASPLVLYYVYRDCVQKLVVKDEDGNTLEEFTTRQDYWIRSADDSATRKNAGNKAEGRRAMTFWSPLPFRRLLLPTF